MNIDELRTLYAFKAEWIWLQRWLGVSPRQVFAEDEFPDVDAIESRWRDVERDRQDFIVALTEDRLRARLSSENVQGQRWEYSLAHMMHHVVIHFVLSPWPGGDASTATRPDTAGD